MPGPQDIIAIKKAYDEIKDKVRKVVIQHFPLGSTAISDVWYNSTSGTMWIKFRKVKAYPKYRFEEVPQSVVVGLVNSISAGSYYHDNIKGNFYTTEIKGPGDDDEELRTSLFQLMK